MPVEPDRAYRDVRALSRGLKLLEALAEFGWAKPSMLSSATGLDRATIYRLLETFTALGYVTRRAEDGGFAMTRRIRWLAAGVRDDDMVLTIVGRHLADLVREVKWPSDFARLLNGRITIEESTHSLSPVTFHRATIGQGRSILRSSLGQAILSVLKPEEIPAVLDLARKVDGAGGDLDLDPKAVARIVSQVRRSGYASAVGSFDPNVSAIAVPLRAGETIGAINIVFFRKVMSPKEAASRFLDPLRHCVDSIVEETTRMETLTPA